MIISPYRVYEETNMPPVFGKENLVVDDYTCRYSVFNQGNGFLFLLEMKRLKKIIIFLFLIVVLMFTGCSTSNDTSSNQNELIISAASSLTDALNEVKKSFEAENPDVTLSINYGGSGNLAQQIEQGAPVDLFLSASERFMNQVAEKGLIMNDSKVAFASNQMVLITNKDNSFNIDDFKKIAPTSISQLSIGNPESVPAGKYAKEILVHLNLWDPLTDKIVYGKNVRQVLAYVESDNVDLGIVYSTDAYISDQVKIIAIANSDWHNPIVYPGAIIENSNNKDLAKKFLDYLTSQKGKNILRKYGFK